MHHFHISIFFYIPFSSTLIFLQKSKDEIVVTGDWREIKKSDKDSSLKILTKPT